MCLYTKNSVPYVAERDISVIKELVHQPYNIISTPYQHFRVNFCLGMCILNEKDFYIENSKVRPHCYAVYRGIHSYKTNTWFYKLGTPYNAIIPKNSEYYDGIDGDMCSLTLIVFEDELHYKVYKSIFKKLYLTLYKRNVRKLNKS